MYDEKIESAENRDGVKAEMVQNESLEHSVPCLAAEGTEKKEPVRQAAALIHSRTRYRDYREGLLARPRDMTEAQAYQWKQQLLRCTREPEEMRAGHQVRQAVICDGVYGAAGVAAYFRDIATGSFEDEGRRPAYGFVGLVWKNDSLFRPAGFPSMADFRLLVEKYVIPRWEEPKNGRDAEKATLSDYQERWIEGLRTKQADAEVQAYTETQTYTETQVRQALEKAVRGEQVFYCSGLPEQTCMEELPDMAEKGRQTSGPGLNRGLVTAGIICGIAIGILIWKILST